MPMPAKQRPAGFAAYAKQFGRKASRAHFQIAHTTYDRWCAEVGITMRRVQTDMPLPNGFAGHASVSSNEELQRRYNVGKATIVRWRKEAGVPGKRNGDTKKPLPETFKDAARGLSRPQLCERYGVCDSVIRRWQKEAGVTPFVAKRPLQSWGQTPPLKTVDNRPDSLVTRAQSHLQHIGPVWRKNGVQFYVFGHIMAVEDMIARAEQTGFDADQWRRLG